MCGYLWDVKSIEKYSRSSISSIESETDDFINYLNEIKDDLGMNKKKKSPPEGYLCHLCYTHGHFIKDCLYVSAKKYEKKRKMFRCDLLMRV